ncbi:Scavenger receptor cysteine-rich type 1 protein M130 Soluble CD163 [Larimichthys crocea]|uniref:Scavenger receptor cysteine-rich type 1 protein M130 Soluble CD163 n=1 Tax=Larimichthys crocea TaxID=215358 RepID=A0A6G0ITN2_LARCR|nr:Scavenger receptor cysteine-rich type 1 protein M130 Soluble CD163 [Larimichthys crocea]
MDRVLVVFVLLWSSGLQIEESDLFKEHRLVNRPSRCSAKLQVYDNRNVDLDFAHKVCRSLDCGSVVRTSLDLWGPLPIIWNYTRSGMRHFRKKRSPLLTKHLDIICSDSVRLVNGTSLCSGRLELKSNQSDQSDQSWSSVCQADFDQQDAEVVCRELGCGPPSVLQGELNGEAEAPTWTKEFQCGGNESALLDCKSSDSVQTSCPSGQAVRLTCSEPDIVRLVGGSSRCAGVLEVKQQGEWRTVDEHTAHWNLETADVVCRALNCGSAVSTGRKKQDDANYKWSIRSTCLLSGSAFRECVYTMGNQSTFNLEVICSDLLLPAFISSTHTDGVSEATQQGFQVLLGSDFTITCFIQPQYPGGSFQLMFTTSATSQNYTQPAVNHSAHFLFSAASHAHQGEYRCVYHVYVFSHNFSSESRTLAVTVSASLTELLIRLVVLVLVLVLVLIVGSSATVFYYYKATRGQPPKQEDNMELDYLGGAEDCPGEEAGARGTD